VRAVKLNGKPYTKLYLDYKDVADGGVLTFEMSASPNKTRGQAVTDKPYSLTSFEENN
jgi:putative alpha-1,2-mannosidase